MRTINEPDTRTKRPFITFLCVLVFFQMMGGLMGWITAHGVDDWYQTLHKSPLTPPDAVFGIVWSALYALLATAFWLLWKLPESPRRKFALRLFAAHMVVNWLWSPLFFIAHATGASLAVISLMIVTAAMIGWMSWPMDRRAALIFAPYIGWLCFAGHLCHYVWTSN